MKLFYNLASDDITIENALLPNLEYDGLFLSYDLSESATFGIYIMHKFTRIFESHRCTRTNV
jgi:hypothetical protein